MLLWIKKLSSRFRHKGSFFFEIASITGIRPHKEEYYKLALRHSSASGNDKGQKINNQRLEYLGDAILGAVVAEYLYLKYPCEGEGFLTSMRSKIVSRKHLNWLARQIDLPRLVVKKTKRTAHAKSIYGDAIEALIGAIYLDLGFDSCRKFIVNKLLNEVVDLDKLESQIASHKGALLEWSQKCKKELRFELTRTWGESHARRYEITIIIDDENVSKGVGSSKKRAEEEAAKAAYSTINEE